MFKLPVLDFKTFRYRVSPLYLWVLHLWIQPTVIKNIPEKKNSRKFQKVKSKFATVATIYIAFTLYLQLFT